MILSDCSTWKVNYISLVANSPIYSGRGFGNKPSKRFSMWHKTLLTLGASHHFSSLPLNTITMLLLFVLIKCPITRFHIICNFFTRNPLSWAYNDMLSIEQVMHVMMQHGLSHTCEKWNICMHLMPP